ncbi:hypothetical protein IHE44_0010792, partial [Lamprotornis superbus]
MGVGLKESLTPCPSPWLTCLSDVLALPIFKQEESSLPPENQDKLLPFQYVLCAATSPAVKLHDETLTYLNQGQSYEIRMLDNRKLGELPEINGKLVKSIFRVVFHDRRLQYTEHQQLEGWRWNRPGDRILDIDIPMSVGIIDPRANPTQLNTVEFLWDPAKRTSVRDRWAVPHIQVRDRWALSHIQVRDRWALPHIQVRNRWALSHIQGQVIPGAAPQILALLRAVPVQVGTAQAGSGAPQVHCISTEFTLRKHGGEKGVPFRVQIDTFRENESGEYTEHLHSASCQIKVFKPKGADRKQKTDREKMEKRTPHEKEKYQPSYETTILTECPQYPQYPRDRVPLSPAVGPRTTSPTPPRPWLTWIQVGLGWIQVDSGGFGVDSGGFGVNLGGFGDIGVNSGGFGDFGVNSGGFGVDSGGFGVAGADLLKLTREDVIQICGPADGIRLFNALKGRMVRPRLTIYVCQESQQVRDPQHEHEDGDGSAGTFFVYHAVYLEELTAAELSEKLAQLFRVPAQQIQQIYKQGPTGIHVLVSDE